MDRQRRMSLAGGALLILVGAVFLVIQLVPEASAWFSAVIAWPLLVVGAGIFLLLFGLLFGEPDMAVPASIVAGIGGILYWQNATGRWESWAYAWTLIPGFVGIGVLLSGLLGKNTRRNWQEGLNLVFISLVLFAVFASFLGGREVFGPYWPVLIILLGVWLLVRPWLLRRS